MELPKLSDRLYALVYNNTDFAGDVIISLIEAKDYDLATDILKALKVKPHSVIKYIFVNSLFNAFAEFCVHYLDQISQIDNSRKDKKVILAESLQEILQMVKDCPAKEEMKNFVDRYKEYIVCPHCKTNLTDINSTGIYVKGTMYMGYNRSTSTFEMSVDNFEEEDCPRYHCGECCKDVTDVVTAITQ